METVVAPEVLISLVADLPCCRGTCPLCFGPLHQTHHGGPDSSICQCGFCHALYRQPLMVPVIQEPDRSEGSALRQASESRNDVLKDFWAGRIRRDHAVA